MKTNNRLMIEDAIKSYAVIGCYDDRIDKLSQDQLIKLLNNIIYTKDIKVIIDCNLYWVEIHHMDIDDVTEIDLIMYTESEYVNMYYSGDYLGDYQARIKS